MGNLAQDLTLIECSINEFYAWENTLNIELGPETKMQVFKKGMTNQNSKANKRLGNINEFYAWENILNIELGPETKMQVFKKGMTNQNSKANKRLGKIFSAGVMGYSVLRCFSHVLLFVTPWTVARQAPLPMGILQARILEWVAMPSSRGSSQPRD